MDKSWSSEESGHGEAGNVQSLEEEKDDDDDEAEEIEASAVAYP